MEKREIGNWGEDAVCRDLESRGAKILARNYHYRRLGEIDVIAKIGEYIVFVEVKTRRTSKFGTPAEYVDRRKQEKLIKAALGYLNGRDLPARFDVAEVYYRLQSESPVLERINYIENAF